MVEPKPDEAASTERSTSAEVDLILAAISLDAATSAFCALVALVWIAPCAALAALWMVSVEVVATAASDRSISVEIERMLPACSVEADGNGPCGSRALPRIADAVSAPNPV